MADDEPLTHADLERIDKEIREDRVGEIKDGVLQAVYEIRDYWALKIGRGLLYLGLLAIVGALAVYGLKDWFMGHLK